MNEAIMEADEDDKDDKNGDDMKTYLEEPSFPRGSMRPKRYAEMWGEHFAIDR